jgi:hypothetical protein
VRAEIIAPISRASTPRRARGRSAAARHGRSARPSASPTGASSEASPLERRRSMSMTSFSSTLRRRAISAAVGSMPIAESGLLLVQVEEELALRLRRAELHQAPVVEDEAQDVRADPPRRVRRELHAAIRIVALHGLHQADVALLDEVHDVLVGAAILVRELHHEAQVRRHQARRGAHVAASSRSGFVSVFSSSGVSSGCRCTSRK